MILCHDHTYTITKMLNQRFGAIDIMKQEIIVIDNESVFVLCKQKQIIWNKSDRIDNSIHKKFCFKNVPGFKCTSSLLQVPCSKILVP